MKRNFWGVSKCSHLDPELKELREAHRERTSQKAGKMLLAVLFANSEGNILVERYASSPLPISKIFHLTNRSMFSDIWISSASSYSFNFIVASCFGSRIHFPHTDVTVFGFLGFYSLIQNLHHPCLLFSLI